MYNKKNEKRNLFFSLAKIMDKAQKAIENYKNDSESKTLVLSNLNLTEIPKEVYGLKNLTYLDLSQNKLSEIPDEIKELELLEFLILRNNDFKKFPDSLYTLQRIKHLSFQENPCYALYIEDSHLINYETLKFITNRRAKAWVRHASKQANEIKKLKTQIKELEALLLINASVIEEQEGIIDSLRYSPDSDEFKKAKERFNNNKKINARI